MITFVGPLKKFAAHGFTFMRDEPREAPPAVAEALAGHPWFVVALAAPVAPVAAPEPKRKPGRPRKADGNGS